MLYANLRHGVLAFTLLAMFAVGAGADTVDYDLGDSGWKLNGPSYYDLNVRVEAEGGSGDDKWVALSVSKNFRFGSNPFTGVFPSITLSFSQADGVADDDLAKRIIILNESITNESGEDWGGFQWVLYRHSVASYNQAMTNPTDDINEVGGWFMDAFTEASWSENPGGDTETLSMYGGTVEDGEGFYPGTNGQGGLVIDIDLSDPNRPDKALFKLAQIPEPGSLALLVIGGAVLLRRRRLA